MNRFLVFLATNYKKENKVTYVFNNRVSKQLPDPSIFLKEELGIKRENSFVIFYQSDIIKKENYKEFSIVEIQAKPGDNIGKIVNQIYYKLFKKIKEKLANNKEIEINAEITRGPRNIAIALLIALSILKKRFENENIQTRVNLYYSVEIIQKEKFEIDKIESNVILSNYNYKPKPKKGKCVHNARILRTILQTSKEGLFLPLIIKINKEKGGAVDDKTIESEIMNSNKIDFAYLHAYNPIIKQVITFTKKLKDDKESVMIELGELNKIGKELSNLLKFTLAGRFFTFEIEKIKEEMKNLNNNEGYYGDLKFNGGGKYNPSDEYRNFLAHAGMTYDLLYIKIKGRKIYVGYKKKDIEKICRILNHVEKNL